MYLFLMRNDLASQPSLHFLEVKSRNSRCSQEPCTKTSSLSRMTTWFPTVYRPLSTLGDDGGSLWAVAMGSNQVSFPGARTH